MRTILITKGLWLSFCLFCTNLLFAQSPSVLDGYIQQGLKNNITLQQKQISVEKALYALQTAQSYFLPSVDLQAGYQTGEGGRSISIPIGDLVNPVYTTLNQLTSSNRFPQVTNQQSYFLPNNFSDVKLMTTVPIINKNLQYNKEIQAQQVNLQKTDVDLYKRELIKNIKTAYFNYLSAMQAIKIYEASLQLAVEGKRTNEKLVNNGKGLPAYILRSESEMEKATAALQEANQQANNAKLYFNFLLNTDPKDSITTNYNTNAAINTIQPLTAIETTPREEIKMIEQTLAINQKLLEMNKNFAYPKLNGFLNTGTQAEKFKYSSQSFYYLAGVQLDIPIFHGKRNQLKIKQAELDLKNTQSVLTQSKQQINLSSSVATNNLQTALSIYQSSLKQEEAAASYQRLIEKGYKEGVNTFIETIDARTQLTSTQLLVNINRFKVLSAAAIVERENASYTLQP